MNDVFRSVEEPLRWAFWKENAAKSARSLRVDAQRCSEQATTVNLINSTQERPVLAVIVIQRTNTAVNRQQDDTKRKGWVKAPLISRRETVDQINPSLLVEDELCVPGSGKHTRLRRGLVR